VGSEITPKEISRQTEMSVRTQSDKIASGYALLFRGNNSLFFAFSSFFYVMLGKLGLQW